MKSLPPLDMEPLPSIDLRHFFVMTDDTGILQHASYATPDLHHGYCTDDNARALIAAVKVWQLPEELWAPEGSGLPGRSQLLVAIQRYLAFLAYAFNSETGRFRNFMQYDRGWLEEVGSEDSHARTLWGLGKAVRFAPNRDVEDLAEGLLERALPAIEQFHYLRPWAYSILGLEAYLCDHAEKPWAREMLTKMAQRLYEIWQANATEDWPWWEEMLTWGNAKLPHAMLAAGQILQREDVIEAALKSLRWLLDIQTGQKGQLSIIGNQGWYYRGKKRAKYDQQPIEAKALVQACVAAAGATGDAYWTEQAKRCFEWFTGRNDAETPLYNPQTGGGQDGLHAGGINVNQGAESTMAYLMSVLELHHYERMRKSLAEV